MQVKYYQACYGRADTGWSVVNTSPNIPKSIADDFAAIERGNAAAVSGRLVPMGANETPSCMLELYCKNDALGLVRVQYHLSDIEGRPISFAHGYIFPDAYELLKNPGWILSLSRVNFADQRISQEEKEGLRKLPGELNRELMKKSVPELMPGEFICNPVPSLSEAMSRCGLDKETYKNWIIAVYSQVLATNIQKTLYVKTDGSEEYALNLLYLTYLAIPYSLRPLLTASTYLKEKQRNTKLIFCAELPAGVPHYDPITGETNTVNDVVAKRLDDRNPVISAALGHLLEGTDKRCFEFIEACLDLMADAWITNMQSINLAYSIYRREFQMPERLPLILHNWLALPVQNNEDWEEFACFLFSEMQNKGIEPNAETAEILSTRLKDAVTDEFVEKARSFFA